MAFISRLDMDLTLEERHMFQEMNHEAAATKEIMACLPRRGLTKIA